MQIQLDAKICSRDTTSESHWNRTSLPFVDAHMADGFLIDTNETDVNNKLASTVNCLGHTIAPKRGLFNFPTEKILKTGGCFGNIDGKSKPVDSLVQPECFLNDSLGSIDLSTTKTCVPGIGRHIQLLPTKTRTQTITAGSGSLEKSSKDKNNVFFQGDQELNVQNWESNVTANPSSSFNVSPQPLQGSSKLRSPGSICNPFSTKTSQKSTEFCGNGKLLTTNKRSSHYSCEENKNIQNQKSQALAASSSNYPYSSQIERCNLKVDTTVTHVPPLEGIADTCLFARSSNQLWSFDGKVSPVKEILEYPTIHDHSFPSDNDILMQDFSVPTSSISLSESDITCGLMTAEGTPPIGAFLNVGFVNKAPTFSKKKLPTPVSKVGSTWTSPTRNILKPPTWMESTVINENETSSGNTTSSDFSLPPVLPGEATNTSNLPFIDKLTVPSMNEPLDMLDLESLDSEQGCWTLGKTEWSTCKNPLSRSKGIEEKSANRSNFKKLSPAMQCNPTEINTFTQPAISSTNKKSFPILNGSLVSNQASKLIAPTSSPNLPVKSLDYNINSKVSSGKLNGTTAVSEKPPSWFNTKILESTQPSLSTIYEKLCTISSQTRARHPNQKFTVNKANELVDFSEPLLPNIVSSESLPFISMGKVLPFDHKKLCNPPNSKFPLVFKEESDNPVCCPATRAIDKISMVYSSKVPYKPSIIREPSVKADWGASLGNNIKLELSFLSNNAFKNVESGTPLSSSKVDVKLRRKRRNQNWASIPLKKRMSGREARYPCSICGKSFKQRCHLYRHIRQHTGKKRFICQICSHGFFQRSNLRQHVRTHSTNEKISHRFACHVCPKRFTRKQGMVKHVEKMHGIIF